MQTLYAKLKVPGSQMPASGDLAPCTFEMSPERQAKGHLETASEGMSIGSTAPLGAYVLPTQLQINVFITWGPTAQSLLWQCALLMNRLSPDLPAPWQGGWTR